MPAWVDTPEDERAWHKAKKIVEGQRKKSESDFSDRDWGLVTHIAKNILSSALATADDVLVYRLAKVEHALSARRERQEQDHRISAAGWSVMSSLRRVADMSGRSLARFRRSPPKRLDASVVEEISALAERMVTLLNDLDH